MPQPQRPNNSRATRETDVESPHLALSSEALISLAQATMVSYATVPATDLESEATLLNSKPKTKTSFLVGGVAAAAFVLGVLSMCGNFRRWRGTRYLMSTQVGRLQHHHDLRSRSAGF